jgi:hyperosmotically inducible periplasmic protein
VNTKFAGTIILASVLLAPVFSYAVDSSTDTTSAYLDDATITTKVKAEYFDDKWIKGRDISVRTDHGVVDLTGTVDSMKESDRATRLASRIEGVTAVHNNLKVNPS